MTKLHRKEETCKIEFKEYGLEITGPCAQGFFSLFEKIFEESKKIGKEISAYACVNPKTGAVEKIMIGKIGTPKSTSLPYKRVCSSNHRQVSIHTHPISGESKFSKADAITITSRMNKGFDDGSCVVGEDATQCFIKVLVPKRKG